MSSSNTNSHSKPQPQACLFLYIAVFDCLRCYTIVDVFSSVFPFIQEANMALQTHSPSHSHNNINNNKGVFGDVYTIIKDMHADHHNATFDFRLPPLPVTCPPLFPSPLIVPTFCLFFFQFFYFPFSEFSGLSRGPRVFQRCPCRGNDKGYTCSSWDHQVRPFSFFFPSQILCVFVFSTWLIRGYSLVVICQLCVQDKNGCWCWIEKYCW